MVDNGAGGERDRAEWLTDRVGLGVPTRLMLRDLVNEVRADTGRAEPRRPLLPARVVAYFAPARPASASRTDSDPYPDSAGPFLTTGAAP